MILSSGARALRKQQQMDRLFAKRAAAESGDYGAYREFYENQGIQKARAAHNAKIAQARQLVRSTRDQLDEARVTGAGIQTAMASHATAKATVVALEQEKQAMFGRASAFGISGGDA